MHVPVNPPEGGLRLPSVILCDAVRSVDRRRLIELISRIGEDAGPLLVRRLEGAPWYLQRNLLTILGYLHRLPEGFVPLAFVEHKDRRVAAEAIAGRLDLLGVLATAVGASAAWLFAGWFWRLGLRNYTGASA